MFKIDSSNNVHITRGDVGTINVGASNQDGEAYTFQPGDIVTMRVMVAKKCDEIKMKIDVAVTEETDTVQIIMTEEDTTIGEIINKPVNYWYEIELNPCTNSQTIVGYDEDGPKLFRLYPEGEEEC